jgi:hypothetical protein
MSNESQPSKNSNISASEMPFHPNWFASRSAQFKGAANAQFKGAANAQELKAQPDLMSLY